MTMTELSRASGVSRTYISELESGKAADPSVAVVTSLATALGISPASMFDNTVETVEMEIPQSLREAAQKYDIHPNDVRDLARVKFRNYQPANAEDWKFLLEAIKKSLPRDADVST